MTPPLLAHEDLKEFIELLETYRKEFTPATQHERFLVDQLAGSQWRLARFHRFETIALEQILAGESPTARNAGKASPDERIVARLAETSPNILELLCRLASGAERSCHRAYRELSQARAQKLRNEANAAEIQLSRELRPYRPRHFDPHTVCQPGPRIPAPAQPGANPRLR